MYKILLLEDDLLFSDSLEDFLQEEGFCIDIASTGEEALDFHYENNYDLYIFDINVPKIDGLEVLSLLKENQDKTPAIFLTSYKDKDTLKKAFMKGCDDFIKKPVDLDELLFRIKAVLRRGNKYFQNIVLNKDFEFNQQEKRLYKNQVDLQVPTKILELLELFIENQDKIVTKDMIISRLWNNYEIHSDGSIRVYVNQIKTIFGNKDIIKNIKGIGYKFEL